MTATVGEIVKKTTDFFGGKSETARLDSELLIASALGWQRLQVYLKHDTPLSEDQLEKCRSNVRRRSKGEPVAYILGEKGFYKHDFEVTSATLIPRPETEMLVVRGLEILANARPELKTKAKSSVQIEIAEAQAKKAEAERALEIAEAKERGLSDDEIAALVASTVARGLTAVDGSSNADRSGAARRPDASDGLTIIDLGCGTGCIGLSIAAEIKSRFAKLNENSGTADGARKVRLLLCDISENALAVARRNAERLGLLEETDFIVADAGDTTAFEKYFGAAELVVANPPYIDPADERVQAAVKAFEPASALFAGEAGAKGLLEIERWSKVARQLVKSAGATLFEIGDGQGADAARLFNEAGWDHVKLARDLSDRERMVEAWIK